MSTRGVYTFVDTEYGRVEYHVYKHSDNYPEGEHGGICAIEKALKFAWKLPRFEADEFAASFVASAKDGEGNVRLFASGDPAVYGRDVFPGDIEYHYIVTALKGILHIECRYPPSANGAKLGDLVKKGTFVEMKRWAMKEEKPAAEPGKPTIVPVARAGDHRTGSLSSNITPAQIKKILGFAANVDDDKDKVKHSWGFEVDGKFAAIWDYKGSRWSTFDPDGVLPGLFSVLQPTT